MSAPPTPSHPATYRAAVLSAPQQISIESRAWRAPDPDEVVVAVVAVGVCGSDTHYFRDGRIGAFRVESPLVLGHESSGVVVEVGDAVTGHTVGDRVAIEPGVPCGVCVHCKSGRYNLCREVRFFATPPYDGAFQEYVRIRADLAHALPESVSFEAGALAEPLAVAIHACRKARVGIGTRVLITGAGAVGLLALQVAKAAGASSVVVTDVESDRLAAALELGASAVLDARELAGAAIEADVLLECSGSIQATQEGLGCLAPNGIAALVGMGARRELGLATSMVQERELWITGTFRYANAYPAALDLLAGGVVTVERLVTSHHPLTDVAGALEAGRLPGAIKALVWPGGEPLPS